MSTYGRILWWCRVRIIYWVQTLLCFVAACYCYVQTRDGLLTRYGNYGLRMRRECREHFPGHRLQRKSVINDPGMQHDTCVTHVPWYMSGSLTRGSGKNVPGIPGACATRNFPYLVRGPYCMLFANHAIRIPRLFTVTQWELLCQQLCRRIAISKQLNYA